MTDWDGSWEGTRRRQLASGAGVTPRERLDWLEEAISIAYRSGALPRRRPSRRWTPPPMAAMDAPCSSSRPPRA